MTRHSDTGPQVVFRNALALAALQISNLILPMLMLPYLARVLSKSEYGVAFFGLSVVAIGHVVTDFGFGLSATYDVARWRDNRRRLGELLTSVVICRLLLAATFAVVSGVFFFNSRYVSHIDYLLLLSGSVVAQALHPTWFFQGIQRMAAITVYTAVARICYVVSVFVFVSGDGDLWRIAVANAASLFVAAALAHVVLRGSGFRYGEVTAAEVRRVARRSIPFFVSRSSVVAYTAGSTFFLGLVSTAPAVASYSAAEQLYRGGQSLVNPVVQALFPYMATTKDFRLLRRVVVGAVVVGGVGVVLAAVAGPWIIELIFGEDYRSSYKVLLVFMLVFLVATPSILVGYPALGAMGRLKEANLSVIIGSAVHCSLLAVLYVAGRVNPLEVACAVLITESVVLVIRVRFLCVYGKGTS